MRYESRRVRLVRTFALLLVLAAPATAQAQTDGIIGPSKRILPGGERLSPTGGGTNLGQFPNGGALTPDGRFWWSVSTGWGANDVRIVDLAKRKVVQTLPLPGASGGIAIDPKRHIAYVSVVGNSMYDGFRRGLHGVGGDNVQAYAFGSNGR